MNDTVEKAAPSLAIVELKPQRPGGCVGIFFQLFDWNRRFAKKKIFSKKLLPPGYCFLLYIFFFHVISFKTKGSCSC